jgi:aldehyde dehydrogenase (NAD+)
MKDCRMSLLLNNNRPIIGEHRPKTTSLGERVHINPATGQEQAVVLIGGGAEIDRAVESAERGFAAWSELGQERRRDCLLKLADLVERESSVFSQIAALECGTPIAIGAGAGLAQSWIRYYAGWADKIEGTVSDPIGASGLAFARHEPIGIVGVIIPWNAPLVAIGMTVILALAAGNSVVLKPPTQTPFAALRFGELALEAGIPAGTLNIVPGDAEAGEALIAHPGVGKISFTGGGAIARTVMHLAADHLKPLALELGGKSANIIFDDADIDQAAAMASTCGLMVLSGQGCVLPTRIYAQSKIFDSFLERMKGCTESFVLGDPLNAATTIGPVINERAADRIMQVIDRARLESGGSIITGGQRAGGALSNGYFIEPTIIADVAHDSHVVREEVFGPVVSIIRFDTEQEVVARANDSRFGLGAYVHTNDLKRAHRMAGALQAGAVSINGMLPMSPNLPFGGFKQSGFGREGGRPGFEEFMQIKQVMIHF